MTFSYARRYRGPIQAVLLDWAGTTMDHGCMAPAVVFVDVYKRAGVEISMEEARAPMGAHKRVHIQKVSQLDSVRERWQKKHKRPPNEGDIDKMFADFIPLQLKCLADYCDLIPGTLEACKEIRKRKIKIGSTTGYTREMMEILQREAAKRGYKPESTVCATDVPQARPYPYMCMKNMMELGVSPVEACVKVDDTLPGIEEGLNAGMWTVGLAMSGNEVGLPLDELKKLDAATRTRLRERAYDRMRKCGSHFVIDSIADLMPCIDKIQEMIERGERP
ncbi:MAG: phosphonoacetaldehyde hydrolase [Proteobacteria bacterium]|nr:phosphonoacetaldehyde hydrolase [Pseudomonadota bacterium]